MSWNWLSVRHSSFLKSTPEGISLVPSSCHQGHFYALPQSPQINTAVKFNAGFDRYYQIVKCFRDEDLRETVNLMTGFIFRNFPIYPRYLLEGLIARVKKPRGLK